MGILSKIITAIRGGAREAGEAIVDANAIRIFEQEIKDADDNLNKAKRDLTEVMAKEMQAKRKVNDLQTEISKHEGYVAEALEKSNEGLAMDVANKIAELESELAIQLKAQESFSAHCERLKAMIKKTNNGLTEMKRQLVMVKTTDSVQKASQSISNNYANSGSKMLGAKESLDRIQKRQADLDDRLAAGDSLKDEFEGSNLDDKLKAAGIGESTGSAVDILERIKAKRNS